MIPNTHPERCFHIARSQFRNVNDWGLLNVLQEKQINFLLIWW